MRSGITGSWKPFNFMRPSLLNYSAPKSIDELWSLLDQYGDEGKILAGGQSLMPLLNLRLAAPKAVIDLRHLNIFSGILLEREFLRIGSTTTQHVVEKDEFINSKMPIVALATSFIGHPQIRNRGTFGGSIAHADPSSELPALAVALNCKILAISESEERVIDAIDFFTGPYTTDLRAGEVLKEIRIPIADPSIQFGFYEIARCSGAFAMAGAVSATRFSDDGFVDSIRIGLFGVGSKPLLFNFDVNTFGSDVLSPKLISLIAGIVRDAVNPMEDAQVTANQRRHYASVVVERSLRAGSLV